MRAYYNEHDPFAAAWLRKLIAAGHIAPGDVDERSIEDVYPSDIIGYTQCHFFAGIGVWSHALRRAGWSDDRPVWTGSCPCQPFSAAGKGAGVDDERHLWPAFHHLIAQCKPPVVFGEQVASRDGLAWLDLVHADMEGTGYAFGAVDLCAAGIGAPHIRNRLYWMARDLRVGDSRGAGLEGHYRHGSDRDESGRDNTQSPGPVGATGGFSRVVFAAECDDEGNCPQCGDDFGDCECIGPTEDDVEYIWIDGELYGKRLADTDSDRCQSRIITTPTVGQRNSVVADGGADAASPINGFWRDADWLLCRDGKWRPVEPGIKPLVDGAANRVGRLRGYGNAIVAPVAEAFIRAYLGVG